MLQKIINSVDKHHAILIEENNLSDFDSFFLSYAKSIVCEKEKGFCDSCVWCKKINDKNYYDIIVVDGFAQKIKKEDIQNIINRFSRNSIEDRGIKIYVIKSIENATSQSLNSLLKFLEEPPQNTYAILTTKNINSVLETIKSRTHFFALPFDESQINKRIKKYDLSSGEESIAKRVFSDITEMEKSLIDKKFQKCYQFCDKLSKSKNDLGAIKTLYDEFKKHDYETIKLILKIFINFTDKKTEIYSLLNNMSINPIKMLTFCIMVGTL